MKKRWIYLLTALTLAVGVCAAKPILGAAALTQNELDSEVDPVKYMTIYPENPNKPDGQRFGSDLDGGLNADGTKAAEIVVDLYKVADAVKMPGYDAYYYEFDKKYMDGLDASSELRGKLQNAQKNHEMPDLKADDWKALAQQVAKIALVDRSDEGTTIDSLGRSAYVDSAGLYLVIARDKNLKKVEEYKVTMKAAKKDEAVNGNIATIANSAQYTYIFSPELISLPMKEENVMENDPPHMTSNLGEWRFHFNVYLKPVRVPRYCSLEIEKILESYETEEQVTETPAAGAGQNEKVTFVFRANWTKDGVADSKIGSITFDSNSERKKSIVLKKIPVGVPITITEIYSGSSYEEKNGEYTQTVSVTGDKIKNGVVILDENGKATSIISEKDEDFTQGGIPQEGPDGEIIEVPASVSFTNVYTPDQKKGYGINNEFEYDVNGNWNWIQDGKDMNQQWHSSSGGGNTGTGDNTETGGNTGTGDNTETGDNTGTGGNTETDTPGTSPTVPADNSSTP